MSQRQSGRASCFWLIFCFFFVSLCHFSNFHAVISINVGDAVRNCLLIDWRWRQQSSLSTDAPRYVLPSQIIVIVYMLPVMMLNSKPSADMKLRCYVLIKPISVLVMFRIWKVTKPTLQSSVTDDISQHWQSECCPYFYLIFSRRRAYTTGLPVMLCIVAKRYVL